MTLKEILSYLVPAASIFLTYVLGRMEVSHSTKKEAFKEAYEAFYLPVISLLYESQIWNTGFSRLKINERHKLFDLIVSNIQYMNQDILEYVDVLYGHYAAILGKEMLDIDSFLTHDRTDEIFDELIIRVLTRATWLAHKLHQPKLGEFALELYLDEREEREMLRKKLEKYTDHK